MHSYPMYQDIQQKAAPFSEVLSRRLVSASISVDNQTERVETEMVSGNFFSMLGVKAAAGRLFNSHDDDRVFLGHPSRRLGAPTSRAALEHLAVMQQPIEHCADVDEIA
jgi:hypothetical protein